MNSQDSLDFGLTSKYQEITNNLKNIKFDTKKTRSPTEKKDGSKKKSINI